MEASGLEAVFLGNRARLLRFLKAHGAGDAAEDLLQELWLKLQASRPGPVAQPLSYLYRAANNLMLDRHRSLAQSAKRERDWSDVTGGTVPGRSDTPASDRAMIAREELARAQAALSALGPRVEAVFRRHRIEGIGQKQIAAEQGVSLSTVESDLRKAYKALVEVRRSLDDG
ncbi:RNA polymerase sigma factor [Sphingomonas quercus]|uniref:RNA polymerase sigma factor n=1 Tax=Sphingomonas quercus TaxID=2842451 RepID=A0ABS6BKN3_9SPHN|nr:RNA polymerase sigma factor [Sphingomonas quercus]MBU3077785.1 RNA polymerase sigma factor [Sphingomonas quercus]